VCENWDNTVIVVACQLSQKEKLTLSHTLTALLCVLGKLSVFVDDLQPLFYGLFLFSGSVSSLFMLGKVKYEKYESLIVNR